MSQRRAVALVAGVSVLLGSTVLSTLFELFSWAMYSFLSVGVVVLVAILARTLRMPVWGQLLAMIGGLLLMVTWSFPSGHELFGFLPDGHTFRHFHQLITGAGKDIQQLAIPVGERENLDFLVACGIGLVAIAVDVLAVGLRRPALAGLPLLALYSVPVAIHTDSVSWIPFALGAAGYLWLLMTDHVDRVRRWGRRFTGDGRDMDLWEPSPLAAAGRRVGFAGVVLAVVLPLLVPGLSSGLLDRIAGYNNGTGTGPGSASRLGTSINPITTLRGSLSQGQPINLFQLETNDPDPGYLRTAVADQVTTAGFSPRPPRHSRPLGNGPDVPTADLTNSLSYHRYQAKVTAQQLDDRYLPLFDAATHLSPPRSGDWRYQIDTRVVYADQPATAGQTWSFDYDSFDYQASALRRAPALVPNDPDTASDTLVPPSTTIARRVDALVAGKTTEYDKVRAILDFFAPSNGFRYSLQTKAGTSGSALVDFLTQKRGYCEQYASAMAWMTRQANIPARVVVGYTHGTKLGNSNVYEVTSHEAHAWVEVYFPTFGWVPFDPTPSTDVSGAATFGWAPNPAAPDSSGGTDADQPDKPGQHGSTADDTKGQHGGASLTNSATAHHAAPTRWPYWVLGVVVLLALLALPATRRGLLRRRRGGAQRRAAHSQEPAVSVDAASGAPPPADDAARQAAHAAWDELLDTLVDLRLDSADAETPRTTADRLNARFRRDDDTTAAVTLLARAEERARYARAPLAGGPLLGASARVRDRLVTDAPRRQRIAATLAPRSVLRRWKATTVQAGSGTLAWLGTLRQRIIQTVVPRRLLTRSDTD